MNSGKQRFVDVQPHFNAMSAALEAANAALSKEVPFQGYKGDGDYKLQEYVNSVNNAFKTVKSNIQNMLDTIVATQQRYSQGGTSVSAALGVGSEGGHAHAGINSASHTTVSLK